MINNNLKKGYKQLIMFELYFSETTYFVSIHSILKGNKKYMHGIYSINLITPLVFPSKSWGNYYIKISRSR